MKLFIAEKPSLAKAIVQALCAGPAASGKSSAGRTGFQTGKGYYIGSRNEYVTWCVGHLLEQAEPHQYNPRYKRWALADLPILPVKWQLFPKKHTRQQLETIKGLVARATEIIHAGDPDREGQLLVDQVLNYLGVGKKIARSVAVQRLLVQDLNPEAILSALKDMRSNQAFSALSASALARQRADWLYGINMTRGYTLFGKRNGFEGLLSVGRVQTPVLGLVVRRDKDIAQFTPKPFYEVVACLDTDLPKANATVEAAQSDHSTGLVKSSHLKKDNCDELALEDEAAPTQFHARWVPSEACRPHQDEEGRVLNQSLAEHVAKRVSFHEARVESVESRQRKMAPPLPYNLSTLQVDLSKRYALSAQKVLDCAQSLYERHKLITYPRSDCRYLPKAHFSQAKTVTQSVVHHISQFIKWSEQNQPTVFFKGLGGDFSRMHHALVSLSTKFDVSIKSAAWNDARVGAHHAIIPTARRIDIKSLSTEERLVYETIARQYMLQFFQPYRYLDTHVLIDIQGGKFKAHAQNAQQMGWRSICGAKNTQQFLPDLKKGQRLWSSKAKVLGKKTTPPSHFTDATLIQAMTGISRFVHSDHVRKVLRETDGLGTEATRAGIIELLVSRGFLIRKGKQLLSTPAGSVLIEVLPIEATLPDMTAQWESRLAQINQDKKLYQGFMDELEQQVKQLIRELGVSMNQSNAIFATIARSEMAGNAKATGKRQYKNKGKFKRSSSRKKTAYP